MIIAFVSVKRQLKHFDKKALIMSHDKIIAGVFWASPEIGGLPALRLDMKRLNKSLVFKS